MDPLGIGHDDQASRYYSAEGRNSAISPLLPGVSDIISRGRKKSLSSQCLLFLHKAAGLT